MKVELVENSNSTRYTSVGADVKDYSTDSTAKSEQIVKAEPAKPNLNSNKAENAEVNALDKVPAKETVKQMVSDINRKINKDTYAEYGYHDKTGRVTIKIVDKDSDEVIKEYPAEETLDMIAKVWELAGMFLDEKR